MTNRKALKNLIDNMTSDEVTQGQFNTLLLTSIANSLAIIADALADKKEVKIMGITMDESMTVLQEVPKVMPITKESISLALDAMCKYQRIQAIVKEWREIGLDYDSCDAMDNIERVIENGSDKRL